MDGHPGYRQYRQWCNVADSTSEFLWRTVRPTLPVQKKGNPVQGHVLNLSTTPIPEEHERVLGLGPKYCFEPHLNPFEKIATARAVSRHALRLKLQAAESNFDAKKKWRELSTTIDRKAEHLLQHTLFHFHAMTPKNETATSNSVHTVRGVLLPQLVSRVFCHGPKFATAPACSPYDLLTYARQVARQVPEGERGTAEDATSLYIVKSQAQKMCATLGFEKIAKAVDKCKKLSLTKFFTAKTHKVDCPLRVIVTERGTWQKL
ncbi:hypothetical protein HPB50_007790 [Hyalomma asiaticum]|uniref:Uncharacterized protein n=1 Tax=Hyalomma asiaticum TaxID=266040 RepID=A0ACB7RTJ9_HYAAI|nr:hypothetical protein HPB50_007790 [Hyalomma asiaticum]